MHHQPAYMLARDGRKNMLSMPAPRLDLSPFGRNGRVWGISVGLAGLMLLLCMCVEGSAFQKRVPKTSDSGYFTGGSTSFAQTC